MVVCAKATLWHTSTTWQAVALTPLRRRSLILNSPISLERPHRQRCRAGRPPWHTMCCSGAAAPACRPPAPATCGFGRITGVSQPHLLPQARRSRTWATRCCVRQGRRRPSPEPPTPTAPRFQEVAGPGLAGGPTCSVTVRRMLGTVLGAGCTRGVTGQSLPRPARSRSRSDKGWRGRAYLWWGRDVGYSLRSATRAQAPWQPVCRHSSRWCDAVDLGATRTHAGCRPGASTAVELEG